MNKNPDVQVPDSCKGCGACCRHLAVELVGGLDDVPDHMWDFVKEYGREDVMQMRMHPDGRCIALRDDNTCSIYSRRPMVCKQFDRGKPDCKSAIRRVQAVAADPSLDPASIS